MLGSVGRSCSVLPRQLSSPELQEVWATSSVVLLSNRALALFSCSVCAPDHLSLTSGCKRLAIVDLKEEEAQNAAAELKAEFGAYLP